MSYFLSIKTFFCDLVRSQRIFWFIFIAGALHLEVVLWLLLIRELTLNPLGFSPLWFEPSSGHMWESQVLLTDGQVVFPQVLQFSPTFEWSAQYKWNLLERVTKHTKKKNDCCFVNIYNIYLLVRRGFQLEPLTASNPQKSRHSV